LLNDRLKVTVGNNFEMQGPQRASGQSSGGVIGNLAVDYQLTPDGRYLVRAYRRNEDEGIIEGFVVETGLKFIVSVDYNKFKEIFDLRRQQRGQRREERMERKAAKDTVAVKTATTLNDQPSVPPNVPVADSTTNIKSAADDRKAIPAIDKVSTDEN
jgi:hypothetical protein